MEIEGAMPGQSHGERAEEDEYCSRENSSLCKYKRRLVYIRTVQRLIEKCLLFHMDLRDCVHALAKHASIHPLVTLTVWKGLVRENQEFFRAYFLRMRSRRSHGNRTSYSCRRFPVRRRITALCKLQPRYYPSAHPARLANY
uniref:Uncharacterized protein n=1 Tax=Picea sitchensis TaxID=3332 RepID=A9P1K2_PICSI|nr:unknown [Picea sitchensis]